MSSQVSALEHSPLDFVREVSPEAITFFVDELSGIYLPEDFIAANSEISDVKHWMPEKRLVGKFGRFEVQQLLEDDKTEPLDDVVVMGTTIGLSGLDREGRHLERLRHYTLSDKVERMLGERGLVEQVSFKGADYGQTFIRLGDTGMAKSIDIAGSSIDYGRADEEGRRKTCELFTNLLGNEIQIVNEHPEPKSYDSIIKPSQ